MADKPNAKPTPPRIEISPDGFALRIPPGLKLPEKPLCEACGDGHVEIVRDLQEILPFRDKHGLWWPGWKTHSVHFFCRKHKRPTITYHIPLETRLGHIARHDARHAHYADPVKAKAAANTMATREHLAQLPIIPPMDPSTEG